MDINIDVGEAVLDSPDEPTQYNGHIIIHAVWFDELHIQCLACDEEKTEVLPEQWSELTPNQKAAYWVKKIGAFDEECPSDADSMTDVIRNDVVSKYIGKPSTAENLNKLEADINDALPEIYGTANVNF